MINQKVQNYIDNCDNNFDLVNYSMRTHKWKNAVSLMYFSCFNLARAYWVYLGFEDTNSHKTLMAQFNKIVINEKSLLEKRFGRFLTRLEKKRDLCDYENGFKIEEWEADDLYKQTSEFINTIQNLIK